MLVEVQEAVVVARNDVQVKLDAEVISWAKMVVARRGGTLAEYLSEMIRPIVLEDLRKTTAEALAGADKSKVKRPKRGG